MAIDMDISNYVTLNNHSCTRRGQPAGCYLTVPTCKTCAFQASYFVRIIKPWNTICTVAFSSSFISWALLNHFWGICISLF